MRDLRLMIGAGQVEEIAAVGAYLRIKSAAVPLLIEIEGGKSRFEIAKGGSVKVMPFTRFSVSHSSGTDQAIVIAVGDEGEEQTEGVMTGDVAVSNLKSAVQVGNSSLVRRTITTSAGALASVNPNRAFISIRNQDDVGTIWISSSSVSVGNGWKLGPGESIEFMGGAVFTGVLIAIGDAASNPNVMVWEGSY